MNPLKYDNLIHVEGLKLLRYAANNRLRLFAIGASPSASSPPPSLGHSITMSTPIRHTALPTTSPMSGLNPSSPYPASMSLAVASQSDGGGEFWIWDFVVVGAHPTGTIAR